MRECHGTASKRGKALLVTGCSVALFGAAICFLTLAAHDPRVPGATAGPEEHPGLGSALPFISQVDQKYGKLRLRFEPNRGQAPDGVKFLARGRDSTFFLTATQAILTLTLPKKRAEQTTGLQSRPSWWRPQSGGPQRAVVLGLTFLGANAGVEISGIEPLPSLTSYFIGKDPAKWRAAIPNFERVKFSGIYKGVDVLFYGSQESLEFDLIIAPECAPGLIRLRVEGARHLQIASNGDLVMQTTAGDVRLQRPACRSPKLRKGIHLVRVTMLQASPHGIHFKRIDDRPR